MKHSKFTILTSVAMLVGASDALSEEMTLDTWLQRMRTGLPVALCAPTSPIRACFSLSAEQCEQSVVSATRTCIADMQSKLPQFIRSPEQGREFGSKIGECAAMAHVVANSTKYVESEECVAAQKGIRDIESGGR
jgi:hypothetical protein